jgi:hypothetical protein
MNDIQFKVGQEHENMKGAYKVLAVKKDTICICWENGEQATSAAALQSRIIERMHQERAQIRAKRGAKPKKTKKPVLPVSKFEGLKKDDFSKELAGAAWRHYDGLGGAVAVRLSPERLDIAPWPRYGLPEIEWADFNHRLDGDFRLQAKFFARLDESRLYFGFYVERSDQEEDTRKDWNAFITWLRNAENDFWLNKVASKHDLSICDVKEQGAFAGTITSAGGKWCLSNKGHEQEIESLADFLDSLTDSTRVDLQIAKIVEKDEVVPRGVEIADDIAQLFELLMPLYEASVVFD